jgi:valyl-tRNA synthetase
VREALDAYRFSDAAAAIYQFVWNDFCDWYLEIAKISLYRAEDRAERQRVQHTLVSVLESTLRLLHPFMPFITEELWQRLPHEAESIMLARYPRASEAGSDATAEREMALLMQAVTSIRNIRGEMRISPAHVLETTVKAAPAEERLLREHATLIGTLARARVVIDPAAIRPRTAGLGVVGQSEIYVQLEGLVDLAAERQRLEKEIRRVDEAIAFTRAKLARPDFTERAPAEIVDKEREKLAEQEALRGKLVASRSWVG